MYIYPLKAAHCKTALHEQSLKPILAAKKKSGKQIDTGETMYTVLTVFKLVSNASDGYSRHFSRLFSMAKKSNAACNAAPFKAWLLVSIGYVSKLREKMVGGRFLHNLRTKLCKKTLLFCY